MKPFTIGALFVLSISASADQPERTFCDPLWPLCVELSGPVYDGKTYEVRTISTGFKNGGQSFYSSHPQRGVEVLLDVVRGEAYQWKYDSNTKWAFGSAVNLMPV